MKKVILIILIVTNIAEVFFAVNLYLNPRLTILNVYEEKKEYYSNKNDLEIEVEQIQNIQKVPGEIGDLYITGWIPDWDIPDGFTTLKNNSKFFDSISPVWFLINKDGSLKKTRYANDSNFLNYTKTNNIELIPTISSFSRDEFTEVLNKKENFDKHIQEILQNVDTYNYSGIDIDYEEVYLKDKKLFFKFLETLSTQLHNRNKKLVFSPLAKWGDELKYNGTKMVFDYKRIGELVDEIRVQGYGYYSQSDTEIGPIGPIVWLEDILRYTIKTGVPRNKIVLGIHTYALDWSERPILDFVEHYNTSKLRLPITGLEPADAYYHVSLEKVLNNYDLKYQYNEEWGENLGSYTYQGKLRYVVFPDERSIDDRKKLAAEYGIKGIAFWRIGDEGKLKLDN